MYIIITLTLIAFAIILFWYFEKQRQVSKIYHIDKNIYRYTAAKNLCNSLGLRIATESELKIAAENGANWYNMGWVDGQKAFYPKDGILIGGRIEPQIKLGVNCYKLSW